ncbi:hypothetical protein LWI28_025971 [Acer negundo]|uniref:Uncharacterized protein n=1 Tax=Acer negundo TaxID=4023 RepID=A0AAD5J6Z1_ACENE|nr:hypothetical protein LWI28_025971 [Acer negundo]
MFLQSQSDIVKTWHLLPIEERAKFGQAEDAEVAAKNLSGEQPDHHANVIPNNSDLPPTDEEIPGITNHLGHEAETINTRFRLRIFFKQPTPSKGQYDGAAHGETSHANQGPVIVNHAYMKGIADVLQVVKEIQSTMKTELDDIRTKVNFLPCATTGHRG